MRTTVTDWARRCAGAHSQHRFYVCTMTGSRGLLSSQEHSDRIKGMEGGRYVSGMSALVSISVVAKEKCKEREMASV